MEDAEVKKSGALLLAGLTLLLSLSLKAVNTGTHYTPVIDSHLAAQLTHAKALRR